MKCPGQDTQYWKAGAIYDVKCPQCGQVVEFFKDDTARKCNKCGYRFVNPKMDFGCASYCQFAEQCLGTLPPELIAQKENFFKDKVALEMKKYFKRDFKRIGHATKVARYAERIGKKKGGGNLAVILAAAYLHEIGAHEAEKKHGLTTPEYLETEGPAVARTIMNKLKAKEELINEVCELINHLKHPKSDETVNFKVVYDANLIAEIEEKQKDNPMDAEKLTQIIEDSFLTESGHDEATEALLK